MGIINSVAQLFGRTSPQKPESGYLISLGRTTSGVAVNSVETALSFTAVWACVRVVSESIAGLPWRVFRRNRDGTRQQLDGHQVTVLLQRRPNAEMGAFSFRESMISWALLWGDAYAEIERDLAGRPVGLWPIEPHRVKIGRSANGELMYEVNNTDKDPTPLTAANMFHLHGLGPTGLHGYYVVALFREAIGLGLATQDQAASFFGNAGMPSGFLTHPGLVDQEKAKELLMNFEARHKSAKNRSRVGLLQGGLAYVPVATTNEDAELDKSRTFQILEACRIFRVPPHKVAELSRATFSNIAEQETAFGRDTVLPWAQRLEQEADMKLLGVGLSMFTRMNVDAIMRGDPKSRAEFYEIMERIGAMSPNEIRELEDRDPIGSDGDQYLVPSNFTTLERLAEPPEPPSPPPQFGVTEPEEEEPEGQNAMKAAAAKVESRELHIGQEAARVLLRDLAGWLARRSRKEVEEASRKSQMGSSVADRAGYRLWIDSYGQSTSDLIAHRLSPMLPALVALGYRDGASVVEIGSVIADQITDVATGGYVDGLYGAEWVERTTDQLIGQLGGPTNGETE